MLFTNSSISLVNKQKGEEKKLVSVNKKDFSDLFN